MDDRVIANIFYKEIFSYKAIFLPDIGYVSLVSYSASLSADGRKLTPPYNTIAVYRTDEYMDTYVDLVAAISQAMMVNYDTAFNIYSDFLSSHIIGNLLNIPMVMTINLDDMSIMRLDDRIVNAIEGQDLTSIAIVPKWGQPSIHHHLSSTPGTGMIVVSSLILASALLYVVYYFFVMGTVL